MIALAEADWAQEEFGHSEVGDRRLARRLVAMAATVAASPAGRITSVFAKPAEREAAYRFVQNDGVAPEAIGHAAAVASAMRAAAYPFIYVPIDGTSLNIVDWGRSKGLGTVGSFRVGATGLQVMSAIGVAPDGTPLGVCDQEYWTRKQPVSVGCRHRKTRDRRHVSEKETQRFLNSLEHVSALLAEHAAHTLPCFLLDRGGDAWDVLRHINDRGMTAIVRAARNRRLWGKKRAPQRRYLWSALEKTQVRGRREVHVPPGPNRNERTALLSVRYARVTLDLHTARFKQRCPASVNVVLAREVRTCPNGEKPIEWMLLTTRDVASFEDACAVIDGYARRWTIEEFHRIWKSGGCNVEKAQLRACDHIERWARILASTAMRLLRITKRARTEPDLPATAEFTQPEIDAIIIARKPKNRDMGREPTLAEVVRWVADLGGYTGKSSGGPPGVQVITRGMDKIQLLADHLARQPPPEK
jgi:hypothetical protein